MEIEGCTYHTNVEAKHRTGVGAGVGAGVTSRASAISTEMHAVGEMEVDGKPEGERDDEGDTLGLGVVP